MRIIIPAAGLGKRLRPNTLTTPKPLLRVGSQRIIDYVIDSLSFAEYDEIIFITGYMSDDIEQYLKSSYSFPMAFVHQNEMKGLADAVYKGLEHIEQDDDVIVLLADTIISVDPKFLEKKECNYAGIIEVDDPSRFGIVTCDGDRITSMIEKPEHPQSNMAIAGIYYFKKASVLREAIEYLYSNKMKRKNEYQLTDAMIRMMETGACFRTMDVINWIDCGNQEMLLKAQNTLGGGEYTAGNDVEISNSTVKNSIIDDGSVIENSYIENSVIGKYCRISNFRGRIYAGDFTVIEKEDT